MKTQKGYPRSAYYKLGCIAFKVNNKHFTKLLKAHIWVNAFTQTIIQYISMRKFTTKNFIWEVTDTALWGIAIFEIQLNAHKV